MTRPRAGFTLIEVVLASALLGLITLGTAQTLVNLQGGQNAVQFRTNADNLNESIRTILSSPTACLNTLGGLNVTGGPTVAVANVMDAGSAPGAVVYAAGAPPAGYGALRLSALTLTDYVPGATAAQAQMTLASKITPSVPSPGPQMVQRGVKISLGLDSSGVINSCVAYSSLADVIWRNTATNFSNIYFNDDNRVGSVGINTSVPQVTLDVAGETRSTTPNHRYMPVSLFPNTENVGGQLLQGIGINLDFNYQPASPLWSTGGDGVNSGGGAILLSHTDGHLRFYTFPTITWSYGATFSPAQFASHEFMRVTSGGRVGFGVTAPTFQLQLSQDSAAKPGTGAWTIASDARLKRLGESYARGVEAITRLKPRYFEYARDNALDLPSGRAFVGLVAQAVRDVVPEAISQDDAGYLHLTSDPILWGMVNSLRDLARQNRELRRRVKILRATASQRR